MSEDRLTVIFPVVLQLDVNLGCRAVIDGSEFEAAEALQPAIELILIVNLLTLNHRHEHTHGG